ncbi:MAG: hypothetical protein IJ137_00840 [Eubacterium sp.]|nr:hypothetical protein [Eubacterium sp.]
MKEKEIRDYLSPNWTSYIAVIFFGILALLGIAVAASSGPGALIIVLLFVGLAALASLHPYGMHKEMNKVIQREKNLNHMQEMEKDFEYAVAFCKDKVKAGQIYLFGKNTGTILKYEEIERVYLYVHKTNFVEDKREMKAVTRDKQTVTLCNLRTGKKDEDELKVFLSLILAQNPSIKVGYR